MTSSLENTLFETAWLAIQSLGELLAIESPHQLYQDKESITENRQDRNFEATLADEQRYYKEHQHEVFRRFQNSLQIVLSGNHNGSPPSVPGSATAGDNQLNPIQEHDAPLPSATRGSLLHAGPATPIRISDIEEDVSNHVSEEDRDDGGSEGNAGKDIIKVWTSLSAVSTATVI
jgi:hypothetical protein